MSSRKLHVKWRVRMGFSFPKANIVVFYSGIAAGRTAGVRDFPVPAGLVLLTGAFHSDTETPELPPVNRSSLAPSNAPPVLWKWELTLRTKFLLCQGLFCLQLLMLQLIPGEEQSSKGWFFWLQHQYGWIESEPILVDQGSHSKPVTREARAIFAERSVVGEGKAGSCGAQQGINACGAKSSTGAFAGL